MSKLVLRDDSVAEVRGRFQVGGPLLVLDGEYRVASVEIERHEVDMTTFGDWNRSYIAAGDPTTRLTLEKPGLLPKEPMQDFADRQIKASGMKPHAAAVVRAMYDLDEAIKESGREAIVEVFADGLDGSPRFRVGVKPG